VNGKKFNAGAEWNLCPIVEARYKKIKKIKYNKYTASDF